MGKMFFIQSKRAVCLTMLVCFLTTSIYPVESIYAARPESSIERYDEEQIEALANVASLGGEGEDLESVLEQQAKLNYAIEKANRVLEITGKMTSPVSERSLGEEKLYQVSRIKYRDKEKTQDTGHKTQDVASRFTKDASRVAAGASLGEVKAEKQFTLYHHFHIYPTRLVLEYMMPLLDQGIHFSIQRTNDPSRVSEPTVAGIVALGLDKGDEVLVTVTGYPDERILERIASRLQFMMTSRYFSNPAQMVQSTSRNAQLHATSGSKTEIEEIANIIRGSSLGQEEINRTFDSIKERQEPIFALYSYESYKKLSSEHLEEMKKYANWFGKRLKIRVYGVGDPERIGTYENIVFTGKTPDQLKDEIGKNALINLSTPGVDSRGDFEGLEREPLYVKYQSNESGLFGMALLHVQSDAKFSGLEQRDGFFVIVDRITQALVQAYSASLAMASAA